MIKNRTIFTRDNLEVLRGMDSNSVDLVYLDPPFNSNRNYAAPVGSKAAGAEFKDSWSMDDTKHEWHGLIADEHPELYKVIEGAGAAGGKGDKAYLIYMSMRLLELRRILKPTGSIYYHCDPVMSHGVKLVMDAVFGRDNFRNEIIWRIGWISGYKTQKQGFIRNHDTLLYYVNGAKFTFCKEYIPYPKDYVRRDGKPPSGKGIPIEDTWNCSGADVLDSIMIKSFSKEKTGYPTQKPLALMERIISASSKKDGMVLDPFCGCATTCIAAEKLGRQWIGIDISPKAADLVKVRLLETVGVAEKTKKMLLPRGFVIHRTNIPQRTDGKRPTPYKQIKQFLFGKQQGTCKGCGHSFDYRHFEVDHIEPLAKGGADADGNKQLLCGSCNRYKGKGTMAELRAKLKELGII